MIKILQKIKSNFKKKENVLRCSKCNSDKIFTTKFFKITNWEKVHNRWTTTGYKIYRHCCTQCLHDWEGEKIK